MVRGLDHARPHPQPRLMLAASGQTAAAMNGQLHVLDQPSPRAFDSPIRSLR